MSGTQRDVIATLLGPVTYEQFAARWHEQSPLHVARDDHLHFAELASIEAIEQMLSVQALSFPDVQLSRTAEPVPPAAYTDAHDRILPIRLLEHHAQGATIVLSRAQQRLPALADLCRLLECRLGVPCRANLYLSPAGRQGFAPHYDAHDVFILQIAGAKRFAFYEGGPTLPLADDRFDPALTHAGARSLDLLLEAGSTLYIPRGVMHDAMAQEDTPSLHATIGTYAPSALDLLHRALDRAATTDVRLRRSVTQDISPDATALLDALSDAVSEERLSLAVSDLRDDAALAAVPDVAGLSARIAQACTLDDKTTLRLRDSSLWQVERCGGSLYARCTGAVLECSGALADALSALVDAGELTVGALPADTAEQRAVLAHRLVTENLVEPVTDRPLT